MRVVVTVIEDEPARLSPWKADGGAFSATMGALKVTVYSDRGSSWFWDVKAPDGTTIAASWEPSLTSARNNAVQAASEALA